MPCLLDESHNQLLVKVEELDGSAVRYSYKPVHQVHFEELAVIWPADRRIPTIASRKAWAEARSLNPRNIHNWWYRRRKVAKKLRITIPKDTYDMGIGIPPMIPEQEAVTLVNDSTVESVSSVLGPDALALDSSLTTNSEIAGSDMDTVCVASSPISCSTLDLLVEGSVKYVCYADKGAYMRSSSPLPVDFSSSPGLATTPSREHSPLPPSSPLEWSYFQSPLFLPAILDGFAESGHFARSGIIESDDMESCCSSVTYLASSFSDPSSDCGKEMNGLVQFLPTYATWCLSGFRIACDGSFLGYCACSVSFPGPVVAYQES